VRLGFNTSGTMTTPLAAELPALAAAGFEWVELRTPELRDFLAGGTLQELRALLDGHGLRVGSINALEFFSFRGGEEPALLAEMGELCGWAEALGCACVIAVPSPTPSYRTTWPEVVAESARVFERLTTLAAPHGVTVGLEPLGFGWCSVRTVAGAMQVLDAVDAGNTGLVIDLFHLALGGSRLEELDALDGARVAIVHVDDVVLGTLEAATDADRVLPGEGALPLDDVGRRLAARGFDGLVSVELFRPEDWSLDAALVAERSYAAAAPVVARWAAFGN
jgi:2-keto-myo-inositol isomerase